METESRSGNPVKPIYPNSLLDCASSYKRMPIVQYLFGRYTYISDRHKQQSAIKGMYSSSLFFRLLCLKLTYVVL